MFKRKQTGVTLHAYSPKKTNKASAWIKAHKKLFILLCIVGVVVIGGGIVGAMTLLNPKPVETARVAETPTPEPAPEPVKYYSPLTGNLVKDESTTKQAVTAVMIENSPSARPQSGLKQGGVVFEAIAEGGITRFLVVYQEQKPALVGPVRSVRMYYVDWAAAFNASIAHVGGSAAALKEVRNGNYRDIDQFFNSAYYWRATDRYAPHNVYTNFEKLDELNTKKGYTSSTFTGFARKDSNASTTPNATSISVTVSSVNYNSTYTYNSTTNSYDRFLGGQPHMDREEGQISPRVVIALRVNQSTVLEDGYRTEINAIGTGTAYIFQDGTVQEVTWSKPSRTAQITFKDAEGNEVALARGQTWITAVPNGKAVTWQ